MRGYKKIRAVDSLVDFLVRFVLHVKRIVGENAINNDFFGQLHGESVFVNCDFLDVVSAADFDTRLSD